MLNSIEISTSVVCWYIKFNDGSDTLLEGMCLELSDNEQSQANAKMFMVDYVINIIRAGYFRPQICEDSLYKYNFF